MPTRAHSSPAVTRRTTLAPALVAALALLAAPACKREEVSHYRVAKQPAAPGMPGPVAGAMPAAGAPGDMSGDVPPPPRPTEGALKWTLPKGWSESLSGGMRYATLKAPASGKLDVSVVVLPGPAGGELANVNRWRGQIGLPPIDDGELAKARKAVKTKAGEVALFDFTSEGQARSRMVAGLLTVEGNTWFLKMVGDLDPVAGSRRDFIRILESLRLD